MSQYKINKGFIIQKLGKKTVIFDGEKSALYTFNVTASFIFARLKKNWNINQITDALVKKYGIKRDKIKTDVKQITSDLKKKKIISSF